MSMYHRPDTIYHVLSPVYGILYAVDGILVSMWSSGALRRQGLQKRRVLRPLVGVCVQGVSHGTSGSLSGFLQKDPKGNIGPCKG